MRQKRSTRLLIFMIAFGLLVSMLAACSQPASEEAGEPAGAETGGEAAEPTTGEEAAAGGEAVGCQGMTVGVSNGFVGSEWRSQMLEDMNGVADELGIDLVVESADVDVQGQTQQVQNLINRGVDAIVINPNSQDALNPILEEAASQGILVIAIDQEVSAEGVYNVVIDQTEWARISARWLTDQVGDAPTDLVIIEGIVGTPGNEMRMSGVEEVLADYPNINVVGRESANWDQATGQQVMSDFLASIPNIDAVWTQDGMAEGALQAIRTANPDEWPVMVGEARAGYIQLWHEIKQERPDFVSVGVVNPPGVGASALRIACEVQAGGQIDESQLAGSFGNSMYVPIPFVVTDTDWTSQSTETRSFDDVYSEVEGLPASYTLDGFITQEEAKGFVTQ